MNKYEWVGWIATTCFTLSFFFKTQKGLLRTQMVGALLWLSYGILNDLRPVIVANVLVAGASIISQVRTWRKDRRLGAMPAAKVPV